MTQAPAYDHYEKMKGWDAAPFMATPPGDRKFYDHYLGHCGLAGAVVVEVGFGNGNFLGWAQARGATLYGTEVQPEAVARAQDHGVHVLPPDLAQSSAELEGQVAVMAALDVMEHLSIAQNAAMLAASADMLRVGGLILLRFPNGQSPLSLPVQHGDMTHVSVLSIPVVEQLCAGLPFKVTHAGPPFRTLPDGFAARLVRRIQGLIRRCADACIKAVYGDIPLYANVTMVLQKL